MCVPAASFPAVENAVPETMTAAATGLPSTEIITFPVGTGVDVDLTSPTKSTTLVELSCCIVDGSMSFTVVAAFTVIETLTGPAGA